MLSDDSRRKMERKNQTIIRSGAGGEGFCHKCQLLSEGAKTDHMIHTPPRRVCRISHDLFLKTFVLHSTSRPTPTDRQSSSAHTSIHNGSVCIIILFQHTPSPSFEGGQRRYHPCLRSQKINISQSSLQGKGYRLLGHSLLQNSPSMAQDHPRSGH